MRGRRRRQARIGRRSGMGRTQVESGSSVGRKPHVPVLKKREEHFSYASRTRYTPPLALPPVKSGSLQAHNPSAPPPPTLWPHFKQEKLTFPAGVLLTVILGPGARANPKVHLTRSISLAGCSDRGVRPVREGILNAGGSHLFSYVLRPGPGPRIASRDKRLWCLNNIRASYQPGGAVTFPVPPPPDTTFLPARAQANYPSLLLSCCE